ncbi:MAG: hypothetical protein WDO13_15820 [Verrucomicrobiota bacterium]
MSFSCPCLLGLLPASLAAYHQATSTTIDRRSCRPSPTISSWTTFPR